MKVAIITYLDEKYYDNFKNDFVKTLSNNTDFNGDLLVLNYGLNHQQQKNIKSIYNKTKFITCHKVRQIEAQRNYDILEILETVNYDVVMTIDAGDVWFQDSFNEVFEMCKDRIGYVEENETWSEGWQQAVISNIKDATKRVEIFEILKDKKTIGSGMACGKRELMIEFTKDIIKHNNNIGQFYFGIDQLCFNLAINDVKNNFVSLPNTYDYVIIPNLHMFTFENGTVRDENKKIVKIVHNAGNPRYLPDGLNNNLQNKVTVHVSTLGRYHTTLPLMLISLINQSMKPYEILIYDDNPLDKREDLRKDWLYKHIFRMMEINGILWQMLAGGRQGQVFNHNLAIDKSETNLILRADDDCYYPYNYIEEQMRIIEQDDVGAVGSLVWHCNMPIPALQPEMKNLISQSLYMNAVEWCVPNTKELMEVEHLYSTFIFKKDVAIKAGRYCMELSKVGHREETIFSHRIFRTGKKLIVNPNVVVYHLKNSDGGIRTFEKEGQLWQKDELFFKNMYLKEWGYEFPKHKVIVLNNGLGDHYVFKKILPEIKERYKDYKLTLASCFPEVFEDEDMTGIELITVPKASVLFSNFDKYNVYTFMISLKWNGTLEDAFRRMYIR